MEVIINEFEGFMRKHGTHYNQFYVGIASNPNDRLINGHRINQTIPHIYWTQPLYTDFVRNIERYFLGKGSRGGPGGGDNNTCYIYMYKIMPSTRQ